MDAENTNAEVYVLDLVAADRAARWLRWIAWVAIKGFRSTRRGYTHVLVRTSSGRTGGIRWKGVSVKRPRDLLDARQMLSVAEWSYEVSLETVHGPGRELFPVVLGVSLGQLNLSRIQTYLRELRLHSVAMGELLSHGGRKKCRVITWDGSFGHALRRNAQGHNAAVAVWSLSWPKRILKVFRNAFSVVQGYSSVPEASHRDELQALRAKLSELQKVRVLFISESIPIQQSFQSVDDELQQRGVFQTLHIHYGTTSSDDKGENEINFGVGSARAERGGRERIWRSIKQKLSSLAASQSEEVADNLFTLQPLLETLCKHHFCMQEAHLRIVDSVLSAVRPEVVVVGNDRWWVGQAYVQLARQKGIPSVCVQDGFAADTSEWWWCTADCVAAFSERYVDRLIQHGVSQERCHLTGQPRYDRLIELNNAESFRGAKDALGLASDGYCVLYAAQYNQDIEYLRSTVDAILAVPGVNLLFRPHPSGSLIEYQQLEEEYRNDDIRLCLDRNVFDDLRACDVLVTQHSTVALEAAILGKPIVAANYSDKADPHFLAATGATLAQRPAELTQILMNLKDASTQDIKDIYAPDTTELQRMVGTIDGKAGKRVAKLITALLTQSETVGERLR